MSVPLKGTIKSHLVYELYLCRFLRIGDGSRQGISYVMEL